MRTSTEFSSGRARLLLASIILVGAFLRLWQLGDTSLWLDEAGTLNFAALPWSTLWISAYDNAPPLYYSIIKLVLNFGDTEFIVRLPSALFGILVIPVVYLAAAMIAGQKAGLVAALFMTLSPVQIEFSQEARNYSLLMLAQSVAYLGLLRIVCSGESVGEKKNHAPKFAFGVWLYAAGVLLALYTNNIAVFFVFITQVVFFAWYALTRRTDPRLFYSWLLANALVLVAWSPWGYLVITELLGNGTMDWLEQPSIEDAWVIFRNVHGLPLLWSGRTVLELIIVVLALLALLHLRGRLPVLAALLAVTFVGPLLIWLMGEFHPLYMMRTIAWSFLGTAILVGVAVSGFSPKLWGLTVIVIAVVLGRVSWIYHEIGGFRHHDWREAASLWQAGEGGVATDTAILLCEPSTVLPFLYYARHAQNLPPVLLWGFGEDDYGTRFLLTDNQRPEVARNWHKAVPIEVWRWRRTASQMNRPPMPITVESAVALGNDFDRLDVVFSHCPSAAHDALLNRLAETGWCAGQSRDFKGWRLVVFRRCDHP
jgi:4-amino-4-deoxy-L-arabinose transferase-like glycosyltransferase